MCPGSEARSALLQGLVALVVLVCLLTTLDGVATLAAAQRREPPAWVGEAMERLREDRRTRYRMPTEDPYPSEGDTAIEVAFALCIAVVGLIASPAAAVDVWVNTKVEINPRDSEVPNGWDISSTLASSTSA